MTRRQTPRGAPQDTDGRRRHGWREFRDAYPRIVAGMVVFLGVLLAADAVFAWRWARYRREVRAMRATLNSSERGRLDLLLETTGHRTRLMMEMARLEARGAGSLNLAVSLEDGVMHLQHEGARLREMKVRIGKEAVIGAPPGAMRIAAPRGKRTVLAVLTGDYAFELPAWVWTHRGQAPPPVRRVSSALGPVAIVLSGGAVIYSAPAPPPLEGDHILPGSVLANAEDLLAIAESLKPGLPVYFH